MNSRRSSYNPAFPKTFAINITITHPSPAISSASHPPKPRSSGEKNGERWLRFHSECKINRARFKRAFGCAPRIPPSHGDKQVSSGTYFIIQRFNKAGGGAGVEYCYSSYVPRLGGRKTREGEGVEGRRNF